LWRRLDQHSLIPVTSFRQDDNDDVLNEGLDRTTQWQNVAEMESRTWKLMLELVRPQLPFDTDQSAQREPPTPSMKLDGPSTV
jgi:hypothetical protein